MTLPFQSFLSTAEQSSQLVAATGIEQLIFAFLFGFLASLTPCVYPLIPITLSIFGAAGEKSRFRAFLLSLSYVGGIAVTYTVLGLFAARSGAIFGQLLTNRYVMGAIVLLLVMMALSSLEVIRFSFGSTLTNKANRIGGKGFAGAFLMGLVSGIIAGSCTGPVLAAILIVAAQSQSAAWGALMLFCYAIGMGMIFLVLGTFSGMIQKVPRSGGWLNWVKFILAALIFMVAIFFAAPYTDNVGGLAQLPMQTALAAISVGFLLGFTGFKFELKSLKVAGALALAVGGHAIVWSHPAPVPGDGPELQWKHSIEETVTEAKARSTIAMVDLYADWCAACKEFDGITFKDPKVRELFGTISIGRVDFTEGDDNTDKIQRDFEVIGLPTILFLDSSGKEIPDSRITGFMGPEEFLKHVGAVQRPSP